MQNEFIDYSHAFPNVLIAQGKGANVLILSKLDHPQERADGKRASYELVHRWLSTKCQSETDQAWACVQGSDVTYWQRKEIEPLLRCIKAGSKMSLFEHFWLF